MLQFESAYLPLALLSQVSVSSLIANLGQVTNHFGTATLKLPFPKLKFNRNRSYDNDALPKNIPFPIPLTFIASCCSFRSLYSFVRSGLRHLQEELKSKGSAAIYLTVYCCTAFFIKLR